MNACVDYSTYLLIGSLLASIVSIAAASYSSFKRRKLYKMLAEQDKIHAVLSKKLDQYWAAKAKEQISAAVTPPPPNDHDYSL